MKTEIIKKELEAAVLKKDSSSITLQLTIPLSSDMLSSEEAIQEGVNLAGLLATEHSLSRFDTDGTPIEVDDKKYTSKGQLSKTYQCPFGEFELYRHVYQSNEGGSTYCPLDEDARILVFSTPKFAKTVSQKYSQIGSRHVQRDLEENHSRSIETSITYFNNHLHQMDYSSHLSKKIPIGSGVVEAACKTIVKQRMCNSGMRWTEEGANNVLILRCFNESDGKWKQFWDKVVRWGY